MSVKFTPPAVNETGLDALHDARPALQGPPASHGRPADPRGPSLWSLRGALWVNFYGSVVWLIAGLCRLELWTASLGAMELMGSVALLMLHNRVAARPIARAMLIFLTVGLIGICLLDGQSREVAAWSLVTVPILAASQLGPQSAYRWGALCLVAVTFLHLSEHLVMVQPDDPPGQSLTCLGQVALLCFLTGFGTIARRANDRQWRLLEQQAEGLGSLRDAAVEAVELQSRFLATMSHEIRTPLNGVLGLASTLEASPLDPEQRDWVSTISNSGELLLRIVNDILDFSRLESDQLPLLSVPFEVESVLYHPADLLADQAWAKGIDLAVRILPGTPQKALGDPLRVEQILLNLLSNAVKFTRTGQVVLRACPHPDGLCLEVQDTGIGVEPARVQQLFQPFCQDNDSISRRFGGTGLGLTISRRLARLMGGDIVAECVPGRGSTFRFVLPIEVVEPWAGPPPLLDVPITCLGMMRGTQDMLSQVAHPLSCLDGSSDLAAPEGNFGRPSGSGWVLFDSRSPELEERVRRIPANIPRAVLTSRAEDLSRLRSLGFTAFLFSPLRFEALRRVLANGPGPTSSLYPEQLAPQDVPPFEHPRQGHPAGLRILVAEDNSIHQKVARLMLARLGHPCNMARNGLEALEAVLSRDYDVVLMDLHMPSMDGLEAIRRIRSALGLYPRIIVLSADVLWEQQQAALEAGADGFLAKPLVFKELQALLSSPLSPALSC